MFVGKRLFFLVAIELIDDIFEKKNETKKGSSLLNTRGKNCNGAIDGSKLKI